jgi:transcriptional regulator with PAS, ATPase and Fis domain/Tfp pilus assembly protein PilF
MIKDEITKIIDDDVELRELFKTCDDPTIKDDDKCLECHERTEKALRLAREKKLPQDVLNYMSLKLAIRYECLSNLEKALALYEQIVGQNSEEKHAEIWCDACLKAGVIYLKQSEFKKAKDAFTKLLDIYEKAGKMDDMAKVLMNLGVIYNETAEYQKAISTFQKAYDIFRKLNDEYFMYRAKASMANCHYYLSEYSKAIPIKLDVIDFYKAKKMFFDLSREYNTISVFYRRLGDMGKSIDFCLKSLKIKEQLKDKNGISTALINLGVFYKEMNENEQALHYYQKALKLKKELGDQKAISIILSNIGNIHLEENNLTEAEKCFQESYQIKKQIDDNDGMIYILQNVSEILMRKENYDEALANLNTSLELAEKIGSQQRKHSILQSIGEVFCYMGRFEKAETNLREAQHYFAEEGLKNMLLENYQLCSKLYEKQADFKGANDYLHKYARLKNELFSEENAKKIAELQTKYETEKKEKEAEIFRLKNIELKEKNKQIEKQRNELQETLDKLHQSEIRYHFVSNELTKNIQTSLIGKSEAIRNIIELISTVAISENTNVLITGESGTGKEIIARKIHECSPRKKQNFFAVNCSAIPESLFESQFFGHEKHAFTGAVDKKIGWFEVAQNSTLFLDEISTLSWEQQAKLLRVLEERKIVRVGSHKELPINLRIISASNINLLKKVEEKKFRNDLYHRIATFVIHIPPLRERKEDIPLLLEHFVGIYSRTLNKPVKRIESQINPSLLQYHFPGNIRELRNMVERAIVVMDSSTLRLKDFVIPLERKNNSETDDILPLEEMEKKLLLKALQATGFNRVHAAKLLQVNRKVIERRIKKYGLES